MPYQKTDFSTILKKKKISKRFKIISFDDSSLLLMYLLKRQLIIILNDERKIKTNVSRNSIKGLLDLCTKLVHFTYSGKINIQIDGVAMGSPLVPVLGTYLWYL